MNSFYSFRYCCRWCLRMQVKTSADSLFSSLRNRIFWLDNDRAAYLISIRNFVPIRKTTFRMSYKNSSWISLTKYAVEVNHFMKEIIKPAFNVCTLRTDRDDSDEHVAVKLTHSHSLLLFPTVGLSHSRLQSFARPPPRIAKGDEKVIWHADRRPPWTASLPVAKKRSYLINCTLSITHEVVYPKKNTHLIIHTNLVHFQMV